MKVIHLHHPYDKKQIPLNNIVLAMGFFDGVHRGHQAVLRAAKEAAVSRQLPLAAMTFDRHPAMLFQNLAETEVNYLTLLPEKIDLMRQNGVDLLYIVDFTADFGQLAPQAFVDQYMIDLHAKVLVAGFDYTYGPKNVANMSHLAGFAKENFEIIKIDEKKAMDGKIGSTEIRQALGQGDLTTANHLLGYTYTSFGIVAHGEARGRQLGFPTANVKGNPSQDLPLPGVYAVSIKVDGVWYQGMAQIGYNITFGPNRQQTLEVNILDFNADIYGQVVAVKWEKRLRSEQKFDGVDGLIDQLKADELATRNYFATGKK